VTVTQLIEDLMSMDLDSKVQTFFDRMVLRLLGSPIFLSLMRQAIAFKHPDGSYIIQLEFNQIPKEFHTTISQITGAKDVKIVEYDEKGTIFTGVQIRLTKEELGEPGKENEPDTTAPGCSLGLLR
jgi:hypothetical protein